MSDIVRSVARATIDTTLNEMRNNFDIAPKGTITRLRAEVEQLREAVAECVDAMRDWIVPDGISGDEAMKRIVGALDNPRINPVILEMDKQALQETGDALRD